MAVLVTARLGAAERRAYLGRLPPLAKRVLWETGFALVELEEVGAARPLHQKWDPRQMGPLVGRAEFQVAPEEAVVPEPAPAEAPVVPEPMAQFISTHGDFLGIPATQLEETL